MVPLPSESPGTVIPTADETRLAEESSQRIVRLFGARQKHVQCRILHDDQTEETITIPSSAFRLLAEILSEMAKGNACSLIPVHAELTTQQAADVLNVSRPYLIELLEKGQIPHRKVGTHRRVRLQDVTEYKRRTDAARRKSLEELSAVDQQLGGLGYQQ